VEEAVTLNHSCCSKLRRLVWVTDIRLLLLIENIVQYILFRFGKLLTMCNPVEHNVYIPLTRRAWNTYEKFVAVMKDRIFRLIKILQACQLCIRKSCQRWRLPTENKCYLNKVGSCRFEPNPLSRSLIFYIGLLLTVCPVRLDDLILFMQKQWKQDLWLWFTQCINTRIFFLKIAEEKLSPRHCNWPFDN
jgi:hypothetical protein